jgi:hypothetical protein
LEVDSQFKASEITILEESKRLILQKEYCESVKNTMVQETIKSSMHTQWQVTQAQPAMTIEDLNKIRMLEKTKDVLVGKIEK